VKTRVKTWWYSILLVGVVVLVLIPLGCGVNHVDNAEFFLKRALDQIGDMRQSMWDEGYVEDLDFKLEAIENDVEDALQELYDMQPNY
jgi:hypothetical protein